MKRLEVLIVAACLALTVSDLVMELLSQHRIFPTSGVRIQSSSMFEDVLVSRKSGLRKRLPKALIIGAKKCGTGALRFYLQKHPDIRWSRTYEEHFFDTEKYELGLNYYRKSMQQSYSYQITMEKTPKYFVSPFAAERIKKFNSSIKLILIVRDPIQRFISDYYHEQRASHVTESLEQIIQANNNSDIFQKLLRPSFYHFHYTRWLKHFDRQQIHIVDGDRLISDPLEECRRVEQFLGIQPYFQPDSFTFNEASGFYCFQKQEQTMCPSPTKGHSNENISEQSQRILQVIFHKDVHLFEKDTGLRFRWTKNY